MNSNQQLDSKVYRRIVQEVNKKGVEEIEPPLRLLARTSQCLTLFPRTFPKTMLYHCGKKVRGFTEFRKNNRIAFI
ncbi:MAG: hypothetical protein AB1393_02610 [Candidatus Edwardsbacteria bacterium]